MQPSIAVDLLKSTFKDWNEDKASRLAAALAYYTAFSVAPLLLIAIAIAGLVFGDEAAQGSIFAQLQGLPGRNRPARSKPRSRTRVDRASARSRHSSVWAPSSGAPRTCSASFRMRSTPSGKCSPSRPASLAASSGASCQ